MLRQPTHRGGHVHAFRRQISWRIAPLALSSAAASVEACSSDDGGLFPSGPDASPATDAASDARSDGTPHPGNRDAQDDDATSLDDATLPDDANTDDGTTGSDADTRD